MATLYKTDGTTREVSSRNGRKYTLEELQEYVGGPIEWLEIRAGKLIVNQEGKLMGLPFNLRATALSGHDIAGDALLIVQGERW
jgi:Domain of unknown function (DUF3846)